MQLRLLLGQVPDKQTKLFDRQLWPQLVCMSDLATSIEQTRRPQTNARFSSPDYLHIPAVCKL